MRALVVPYLLIAPLFHLHIRRSINPRSFSGPPRKLIESYSSKKTVSGFTSMAGNTAAAASVGEQSIHVIGEWFSVPELRLRDHRFTVPLDYSLDYSKSPKISVFAREIVSVGKEEQHLPFLLYLQGGPGFECQRPTESGGWISKVCEEYRVILMDQRGTGMSTPLSPSSMLQFRSSEDLANFLIYFRADSIVNDAEFIRKQLVPDSRPWTVLGQSYGGFCAVTYLSFAPEGLKQVLLTGGIPPIRSGLTADDVYRACYEQVMIQNAKYYQRFPKDIEIIQDVVHHLSASGGGVPLPSGGTLTPHGLQLLGLSGLGSSTGFERLHYMFERVWDPILVPGVPRKISFYFLNAYEKWLSFDTNPLYALLHESIYCQGCSSSSWSAHRIRSEHDILFDAIKSVKEGRPVMFTGEMVFPWFFDEIHPLKPFKDVAHLLAEKKDWSPLYDVAALKNNKVPVAAAVYYEDMYVNMKLAMETASDIAGIRLWITNEFMHSGLRDGGSQVVDHLFNLLNGKKPIF